jgi:hypothetical protein
MPPDAHEPSRADGAQWKAAIDRGTLPLVLAVAVIIWLPRLQGPIDLRWDGGVYYILGTSLAQGTGYRLLNEPGEIEAVQYPPLLPALVAASQLALGTSDPTIVGGWLRYAAFFVFLAYMSLVVRFLRHYLPARSTLVAALFCLFSLHVYFLSDLLFPEILFSLATLVFLVALRRDETRLVSIGTYLAAVSSYALRTIGTAAFAVWVLDSLIRRPGDRDPRIRGRFGQAIVRLALVVMAVAAWQAYVASVASSHEYSHPAYPYQRAPYMFYNVTYTRNIALRDPFAPEKGRLSAATLLRRIGGNALALPAYAGETLSIPRGYLDAWAYPWIGGRPGVASLVSRGAFLSLYTFGAVFVLGGFALLLVRGEWKIPLYVALYVAAVCLTPFRAQSLRYLMPIAPLLALSLVVSVTTLVDRCSRSPASGAARAVRRGAVGVLALAFVAEVTCCAAVYAYERGWVSYIDRNGEPVTGRLFYYTDLYRGFDQSIDFVRERAAASDVIAAGMPHWVHLRTGLKTVMPPFELNAAKAHELLDSVPVAYMIVGRDVIDSQRYMLPVVRQFPARWKAVYAASAGDWAVYQRVNRRVP